MPTQAADNLRRFCLALFPHHSNISSAMVENVTPVGFEIPSQLNGSAIDKATLLRFLISNDPAEGREAHRAMLQAIKNKFGEDTIDQVLEAGSADEVLRIAARVSEKQNRTSDSSTSSNIHNNISRVMEPLENIQGLVQNSLAKAENFMQLWSTNIAHISSFVGGEVTKRLEQLSTTWKQAIDKQIKEIQTIIDGVFKKLEGLSSSLKTKTKAKSEPVEANTTQKASEQSIPLKDKTELQQILKDIQEKDLGQAMDKELEAFTTRWTKLETKLKGILQAIALFSEGDLTTNFENYATNVVNQIKTAVTEIQTATSTMLSNLAQLGQGQTTDTTST